MYLNKRFSVV